MAETYKIGRIEDMMQIPPDRLSAFFRDLEYLLHLAHISGVALALETPIEWTDDDDHSVEIEFADGDKIFLSVGSADSSTAEGGQ